MKRTFAIAKILILLSVCMNAESSYGESGGQSEVILPSTMGFFGNFYSVFQANSPLIRPDGDEKKVYPLYQYMEVSGVSPDGRVSFNGFFRGREVFNGEDRTFDVYNAFFQFNNTSRSFELRLGRQIITESFNFFLLDGGLVRFTPVEGIELVAYGGYQDKDAQPDPEEPLESSTVFGFKLKSDRLLGSIVSIGYEFFNPNDFSPRHLVNFAFNRVVPFTKYADIYSRAEFDIGQGNLALFTVGVGVTPLSSVHLNLEYDTYRPDDERDRFLLDAIFDLFSISRLHEARIGVTYIPTGFLEISSSLSYARYDVLDGTSTNGFIAKLGLSWDFWREIGLRAFQGLYFIDGRNDDRAVGLNFGISEEILRGLDLQFSFAYAHFETITNKDGNAFSHIMGVQYLLTRNLVLKAELEVNTNPDFNKDIRTNLGVSYYY
ncbi:MAG TPA: hypothetical protein VNK81_04290 [Thermodesulfobacteriota bacterium]|nr:hypothetical protein [Thermodesulfobacteriota bacterium]